MVGYHYITEQVMRAICHIERQAHAVLTERGKMLQLKKL